MSDHDHDDEHIREHDRPLSGPALRAKALESLLVEKGLVDPKALDELIDTYEKKIGPRNGARIVARAWIDPAYKKRLLEDATAAIAEFGFIGRQGEDMVVLENTSKVRNVVVCTLCSCYPWPVLGLPPVWYKSAPYRARAVARSDFFLVGVDQLVERLRIDEALLDEQRLQRSCAQRRPGERTVVLANVFVVVIVVAHDLTRTRPKRGGVIRLSRPRP